MSLIAIVISGFASHAQDGQIPFNQWLDALKLEAIEKGYSKELVNTAFSNITAPAPKIIKQDNNQPEFKQTYTRYLRARLSDWRKEKGGRELHNEANTFNAVEEAYEVQKRFIAAIWGIESNYGTYEMTQSVFQALTTLAYNPRRAARFRREIFNALKIIQNGEATYEMMKGSWAGAMGQSQFMPANYIQYAQDFDGDGQKDIWNNKSDVFASIAYYLKRHGWNNHQTWGRKVNLPKGAETILVGKQEDGALPPATCKRYKSLGGWRSLSEWQAIGVRRVDGSDLPDVSLNAALVVGDKGDNQGYLVYGNFCVIMRYNPSFKYALGVGMLSDVIQANSNQLTRITYTSGLEAAQ